MPHTTLTRFKNREKKKKPNKANHVASPYTYCIKTFHITFSVADRSNTEWFYHYSNFTSLHPLNHHTKLWQMLNLFLGVFLNHISCTPQGWIYYWNKFLAFSLSEYLTHANYFQYITSYIRIYWTFVSSTCHTTYMCHKNIFTEPPLDFRWIKVAHKNKEYLWYICNTLNYFTPQKHLHRLSHKLTPWSQDVDDLTVKMLMI